jgi:hypothetical protein
MQWTGDNFEDFIAFYQSFGRNQYDFVVNEDNTLTYQDYAIVNVGDYLTMLGGASIVAEEFMDANYQEVADTRLTYTVVDDPEQS